MQITMKTFLKKTLIFLIVTSIIIGQIVCVASAETKKKPTCPASKALQNFDSFLAATISYDGFIEYWKEVFGYHNNCQYEDIMQVHSRIDALENDIRASFYSCRNEKIEMLKPQYYKAKAELFYVRNYVDTKDGNFIIVNIEKLSSDMKKQFSKDSSLISEGTLNEYFHEFMEKYKEHPKTYQKCKRNMWKEVNKKWKELEEHFKSLKKSTESKPKPPQKKNKTQSASAKNSAKNKGGSFLSKWLSTSINGQTPAKGLSAIQQEIQNKSPNFSPPTLQKLSNTFGNVEAKQEELVSKKEMLARYNIYYKQSGDQAFDDLKSQMKAMNATIKDTTRVIGKWKTCAKKVGSRQCK